MEFADANHTKTLGSAVDLTRPLRTERTSPPQSWRPRPWREPFCSCVVDDEDATERQFSAIHGQLVEAVVSRIRTFDADCVDRATDTSNWVPDRND